MSRLKRWWRNEDYDREHMRRFREARPDLDDLPDHVVATLLVFALFSFGEAVRDVGKTIRSEFPIVDRLVRDLEQLGRGTREETE